MDASQIKVVCLYLSNDIRSHTIAALSCYFDIFHENKLNKDKKKLTFIEEE